MRNKHIIEVGDDWYEIQRILKEDRNWDIETLKQYWFCSHTFRRDGLLYFCREVPKIEYEIV